MWCERKKIKYKVKSFTSVYINDFVLQGNVMLMFGLKVFLLKI